MKVMVQAWTTHTAEGDAEHSSSRMGMPRSLWCAQKRGRKGQPCLDARRRGCESAVRSGRGGRVAVSIVGALMVLLLLLMGEDALQLCAAVAPGLAIIPGAACMRVGACVREGRIASDMRACGGVCA